MLQHYEQLSLYVVIMAKVKVKMLNMFIILISFIRCPLVLFCFVLFFSAAKITSKCCEILYRTTLTTV
jgi:hypothetical protein